MREYYTHIGKIQKGPFTLDELKLQNINANTPVWYEGLQEWTTANEIGELEVLFDLKKTASQDFPSTNDIIENRSVKSYLSYFNIGLFMCGLQIAITALRMLSFEGRYLWGMSKLCAIICFVLFMNGVVISNKHSKGSMLLYALGILLSFIYPLYILFRDPFLSESLRNVCGVLCWY